MNRAENARYLLSSLSVFRGILSADVPKAYCRLLSSLDGKPDDVLNAYGELYSLLCEKSDGHGPAYSLTEALMFDDNCFTRAAAAGKAADLPEHIRRAALRDIGAVIEAGSLGFDELFASCACADVISELSLPLPLPGDDKPAGAFENFDGTLESVEQSYEKNGCGIFARYNAFAWCNNELEPVLNRDSVDFDDFVGYERQRAAVVNNTKAFLSGKSCNNCLLFGDMGTGKSSTVKAVANEFRTSGLRIVEMPKERLEQFPALVDKIATLPMKFIIFIDDLSFQRQDASYNALKAVLEGGLAARPKNAVIYATSNRRHLVKESLSDRSAFIDDVHMRDNMQETLSLSDRFGLTVYYGAPSKKEFLKIVSALAAERKLEIPESELAEGAERFALSKGGRSPRCARQYVESLFC